VKTGDACNCFNPIMLMLRSWPEPKVLSL
jgi:hypothetical protein